VRPFDWETEFPEIMSKGGFDCVIGNPPYIRQENLNNEFKSYAKRKFKTYTGFADIYVFFIEKSFTLLNETGVSSFIVANKWLKANYGGPLRRYIKSHSSINQIIDFGELPVFKDAATFPAIIVLSKPISDLQNIYYARIRTLNFGSLNAEVEKTKLNLTNSSIRDTGWTLATNEKNSLFEKIQNIGQPLGEYVNNEIYIGLTTGLNTAFLIDKVTKDKLISTDPKCEAVIKPYAKGDDIRKYHIRDKERFLIFIPKGFTKRESGKAKDKWQWLQKKYPSIAEHLNKFSEAAKKRRDKGDFWWELRACKYYSEFEKSKIIYPDMAKASRFCYDETGMYTNNTSYFIPTNDLFLLGILNSDLIFWYFQQIATVLGDAEKGGRLRFFTQDVQNIPIAHKYADEELTPMVKKINDVTAEFINAKTESARRSCSNKIDILNNRINDLVYDLYDINRSERAIIQIAQKTGSFKET
jgi:hypothetical protein